MTRWRLPKRSSEIILTALGLNMHSSCLVLRTRQGRNAQNKVSKQAFPDQAMWIKCLREGLDKTGKAISHNPRVEIENAHFWA